MAKKVTALLATATVLLLGACSNQQTPSQTNTSSVRRPQRQLLLNRQRLVRRLTKQVWAEPIWEWMKAIK